MLLLYGKSNIKSIDILPKEKAPKGLTYKSNLD
jgi:hypothetical protein